MKRDVRDCDRCRRDLDGGPYWQVTLHSHHDKKVDLCGLCVNELQVAFLGWPGLLAGMTRPKEAPSTRSS